MPQLGPALMAIFNVNADTQPSASTHPLQAICALHAWHNSRLTTPPPVPRGLLHSSTPRASERARFQSEGTKIFPPPDSALVAASPLAFPPSNSRPLVARPFVCISTTRHLRALSRAGGHQVSYREPGHTADQSRGGSRGLAAGSEARLPRLFAGAHSAACCISVQCTCTVPADSGYARACGGGDSGLRVTPSCLLAPYGGRASVRVTPRYMYRCRPEAPAGRRLAAQPMPSAVALAPDRPP
ncbi:hypothetical protein DFH11DRAFT_1730008 [Phellopilus nigrolimitatus]|nr:hypothetical protein DFH11DRAFT_1730008 [Phellopilus nigrolimitatus]